METGLIDGSRCENRGVCTVLHASSCNDTKLELNNGFLTWLMPPLRLFFHLLIVLQVMSAFHVFPISSESVCELNVIQAANREKTILKALLTLVCSSMLHTEAREDTCCAFTSLQNDC